MHILQIQHHNDGMTEKSETWLCRFFLAAGVGIDWVQKTCSATESARFVLISASIQTIAMVTPYRQHKVMLGGTTLMLGGPG